MHLNRTSRESAYHIAEHSGTSISVAEQERPKCKQTGGKRITSRKSKGGWHRKLLCRAKGGTTRRPMRPCMVDDLSSARTGQLTDRQRLQSWPAAEDNGLRRSAPKKRPSSARWPGQSMPTWKLVTEAIRSDCSLADGVSTVLLAGCLRQGVS